MENLVLVTANHQIMFYLPRLCMAPFRMPFFEKIRTSNTHNSYMITEFLPIRSMIFTRLGWVDRWLGRTVIRYVHDGPSRCIPKVIYRGAKIQYVSWCTGGTVVKLRIVKQKIESRYIYVTKYNILVSLTCIVSEWINYIKCDYTYGSFKQFGK